MSTNGTRHFLDLIDIPPQELRSMIDASRAMKARRGSTRGALEGKTLAMIFDKPSTERGCRSMSPCASSGARPSC